MDPLIRSTSSAARTFALVALFVTAGGRCALALDGEGASLHPQAKIETALGAIVVELDAEKAPITVLNFVDYVEAKFYDGTIFHRVVPRSVIQGGAYLRDMTEKKEGLRPPIQCESYNGLTNEAGTIAMYRLAGEPNSARAQFFINHHLNTSLDKLRDGEGYAVFGKVVEGMNVVERIRDTKVDAHPKYAAGKNPVVPVTPVVIQSMRMLSALDRAAAESLGAKARLTADARLNSAIKRLEAEAKADSVLTESGLRTIDRAHGKGAFPLLSEAVEMIYVGTLVGGAEFDSSERQAHGPVTMNLANLIPGLREGLLGMQEGGKRVLIVPPGLAFGAEGIPGRVPGNATLIYDIELLAVRPPVKRPEAKIEGAGP
jgi:cyclophilin family peptidyl-prolyl cis-trans isomerase